MQSYLTFFGSAFRPSISHLPFYPPTTETTTPSQSSLSSSSSSSTANGATSRSIILVGFIYCVGLFAVFALSQLARLACDYYIARWAREGSVLGSRLVTSYYVSIGILVIFLQFRSSYLNIHSVCASSKIHTRVFRAVLQAPVPTFFDTHTVGEILNRFAKDMEITDSSVPEFLLQVLINWFQVGSVFAMCIWTTPWFVLFIVPLGFGFARLFHRFSNVSRDLKRLESVTRSPIYASLSETLTGLDTIRAYGDTGRFLNTHLQKSEHNLKFYFHLWMAMSWCTARLEVATSLVLLVVSLLSVCTVGQLGGSNVIGLGLSLSYGLQLTALFQRCVQVAIDVATYMTSTERVLEYLSCPQESSTLQTSTSPLTPTPTFASLPESKQSHWPSSGMLSFEGVSMRYRDNPLVLKNVTFSVRPGERVGICGRTGSGKSSLLQALFRIVELESGRICIDGIDIGFVPLQVLRRKLALIPQDPLLFTGSFRFQLDPFEEHSDEEIYHVSVCLCLCVLVYVCVCVFECVCVLVYIYIYMSAHLLHIFISSFPPSNHYCSYSHIPT